MLKDYDISFRAGNMITPAMLDTMYSLPRDMFELIFNSKSDGIISGMDITVKEDILVVTKGVFKAGKRLFILREDTVFRGCTGSNERFTGGHYYILYIEADSNGIVTTETDTDYVTVVNADMVLAERGTFDETNKIILCGFKGRPVIPEDCSQHSKAVSFKEGFYILNRCHADNEEPTFHQVVFRAIHRKLLNKNNKHPLDYALITEILNRNIISVQTIRYYISEANIRLNDNISDAKLFNEFLKAIETLEFKVNTVSEKKTDSVKDKKGGPSSIWISPLKEERRR